MRENQRVIVNGLTLSYVVDGPASAPVVLLVHGHGPDAHNWNDIIDDLVPDYRVYAMTMRGHGDSDWPGEYSYELIGSDITGFVEALGLDDVALVGHSLGGIGSVFAAQRQPSWLARLVLEDAPIPTPGWLEVEMPPRPGTPTTDWDNIIPAINESLNNPDPRWWEELANIKVPTLAISGGQRSGFPQSNIVDMGVKIADFRTETIDVGHLVHEAAPERFLQVLRDFISGRLTSASPASDTSWRACGRPNAAGSTAHTVRSGGCGNR